MTKIGYLTIDDSPSIAMKRHIDYLFRHNIPAIWYCRGEFLEKKLSFAAYAIERGFIVGNHSYRHPYFSTISLDAASEEIRKTDLLIDLAYQLAGVPRIGKLFRFPFGDRGAGKDFASPSTPTQIQHVQHLQELLKKEGFRKAEFAGITYPDYQRKSHAYLDASWTYDVKEYATIWENSRRKHGLYVLDDVLKRMDQDRPEEGLGLNDSASNEIILMHDFEETSDFFEPIVERLKAKGLVFRLPVF